MGLRARQKPSLLLVVTGGCQGVPLPCVQDLVSYLFGKSIHVTIFSSVTVIVFCLWFRYDLFHMCYGVIPYVYVDSSYRGACFIYDMKAVALQDGRHGASWAAEAELPVARGGRRVSRCSSLVCGRFGIFSDFGKSIRHDWFRQ